MPRSLPIFAGFAAYAFFTLMDALIKIASSENSVITILMCLNLSAAGFYTIYFTVKGWHNAKMKNPKFYMYRSVFNIVGAMCIMYSFSRFSLNTVYSVIFSAPFLTSILGQKFLQEPVSRKAWLTMGIGFSGVFVALRPWTEALTFEHGIIFIAAACISSSVLLLKGIGKGESPINIAFYGSVVMGLFFLAVNLFSLESISFHTILLLIFCGLLMASATALVTFGFQHLGFAVMGSIQYSQFIWGTLISFLLFSDLPDTYFYVGALLICVSGFINSGLRTFRIKWL